MCYRVGLSLFILGALLVACGAPETPAGGALAPTQIAIPPATPTRPTVTPRPTATPLPVILSEKPKEMLRADLENENDTVRNYRERIRQCELLGEYAIAEDIREILRQEQEHQIDLATALGEEVPDVNLVPTRR